MNGNYQINIFGEEMKDEKKEQVAKAIEKAKKAKPLQSNEKLPEGRPLLVCYARYSFEVSIDEREELQKEAESRGDGSTELDILREKMEREFPELSKERVKWHWTKDEKEADSQLNLEPIVVVPVVTAGTKGAIIEEKLRGTHSSVISMLRDMRPIHTLYARDGIYEVRKMPPVGIFSVRLKKCENIFGDFWQEGIIFALPRIPSNIMDTVIERFRQSLPYEDVALICWRDKVGYYVIFPDKEEFSSTHVRFKRISDQHIVVAEIHSHGTLPAFFSSTDDEDEKKTGIYAVVGRLDTPSPEIVVSYVCGGVRRIIERNIVIQWEGA